ncbi:MAG: hypothetical protein MJA83_15765 [Gammaproteobacteria bacterium]|nr:hypothetical protein [Gammaproteobacteria bacterium]
MNAKTTTARFNAPANKVFAFLSEVENLGRWATGYCKELKKEGDDYKVVTPGGEVYFRIDACTETGIVDMYSGPTKDTMFRFPGRVTDDNNGGSVFAFTAIQMQDQEDAIFAEQCKELEKEFENIRKIVEA